MTIPLVFLAKAMTTRLLLLSLALLFLSTILLANIPSNSCIEAQEKMMIHIALGGESLSLNESGGEHYTTVVDGRMMWWMSNESQWANFAFNSYMS